MTPVTGQRAVFDVAVIGAGIVGAAMARLLARANHSVALLEAKADIGDGTSKANTAILHTGFDATPGTLEARLVARGYALLGAYAEQAGIPVERTGALLVAWDDEQVRALPGLRDKAVSNGYTACELLGAGEVYRRVPALGAGALAGLTVPGESIICTWTTNLALATEAVQHGACLLRRHRVTAIEPGDPTVLRTDRGDIRAAWVVNAAGLGADLLDREFGHDRFTVTPRRGELIVFDKLARPLAPVIVLPVPTKAGKGVLVSPTIYGNVMLGPTADDIDDRTATGTTEAGLASLLDKGSRIMPALLDEEVTATYAGLRAATEHQDFVIEIDTAQRYLLLGGIRSTGLTAGMAIAEHAAGLLAGAGLEMAEGPGTHGTPRMPNLGEAFPRPYQDGELIARRGDYGRIVCFCERVTEGEIRDTFTSTIPPADLGGIRRRTRATNGRCQGFYCGARVRELAEAAGTASA